MCPDAETIAAFAEGRVKRSEMPALMEHIDGCEDCMAALEIANETIATRTANAQQAPARTWWLAAAAAIVIAVISLAVLRPWREASSTDRLIELAPRSARGVEARLSGGFPWAAYRGPMRAEDAESDPQRMRLVGAAGDIVAGADRNRSADAQQAAGVALVLVDQPMQAIARLEEAVKTAPKDAAAWSDLAAAQYAAALHLNRPSLLPAALESADRALRLDPQLAEARFNRALTLERLGLTQEARAAWKHYLEIDAASPWAVEARARLAKLETTSTSSDPQRIRTFAEAETLGRWAEAVQRGDAASAERELANARTTGDALLASSGEALLREAVRAIDDATVPTLAKAHIVYRRGRIAYSRHQLEPALADLTRAAALFRQSPMALVARYYAASARFDQNDVASARGELQTLLHESEARPQFAALGAQVRWELALTLMVDGDWSGALPLLEQSRAAFLRLGERNHLGFIESLLADTLLSLGRRDEAWAARIRAFSILSSDGRGDRLAVSMKAAAQLEARSGYLATARTLFDVATARTFESDANAADLLIHAAMASAALGDAGEAARRIREATAATARIREPTLRELAQTHLELASAAALVPTDRPRAKEMLTRAIDQYQANGRTVFLPECYLLRARTEGDAARAAEDLDSGIAALERSRVRTGAVIGTGVLNAGNALFEDAIRLCADRGDVERAFAYAERSRTQLGSSTVTLRELQQRLASSDAAVLQLVALPNELVAICVTARDAAMQRHAITSDLYGAIIRPFDALLASSTHLIIIPDRSLQNVPFAALYDAMAHRYLIERFAVSTAMSASSLEPAQPRGSASLLAVALPSGDANAGLPETTRELADIAPLYPHATSIEGATFAAFAGAAPNADVIHIAGHTAQESNDAGTALVFARGRVTWSAIAAQHLPRAPVVVLAACATLQQRAPANVRSMILGDGFLAAGATDVIGTLTPIADADARELFRSIHQHLAAGAAPADAVRAAQLQFLARPSSAWRAIASRTRSIPTRERRS
jgi:tetratricopeptide (TPR) repeat protein